MRSPRQQLLWLVILIATPALAALLALHVVRIDVYQAHHELSLSQAVGHALDDFIRMIRKGGVFAAVLLTVNYVTSFGIVIVLTVLASRWLHWKRVACFYVVSVAVLIVIMIWTSDAHAHSIPAVVRPALWLHVLPDLWVGDFHDYWLSYPPMALVAALLAGGLLALLPIFGPGKRDRIDRGVCPKCRYDLKGKVEDGCPECGWNRRGPILSREQLLKPKRAPAGRTMLLLGIWTLAILVVAGVARTPLAKMMPLMVDNSPRSTLGSPRSAAYSDVVLDFTLRTRTGWWQTPGRVIDQQWTAEFRRATTEPTFEEQLAGIEPLYDTLAEITVDQTGGSAVFRHSDDELHFNRAVDHHDLAAWLEEVFPQRSPELLAKEAEIIIFVVEAWQDPIRAGTNPFENLWRPHGPLVTEAFGGTGAGGMGYESRIAPSAIAIVIASAALIWLGVGWVIIELARHTRRTSYGQTAPEPATPSGDTPPKSL